MVPDVPPVVPELPAPAFNPVPLPALPPTVDPVPAPPVPAVPLELIPPLPETLAPLVLLVSEPDGAVKAELDEPVVPPPVVAEPEP